MNIPQFSIPGLMPTTHPVSSSITHTAPTGEVLWDFLTQPTADDAPTKFDVVLYQYDGLVLFNTSDDAADEVDGYVVSRVDGDNTIYSWKFGNETDGYVPAGSYKIEAYITDAGGDLSLVEGDITNQDSIFNKGVMNRKYLDANVDLTLES